MQRTATDMGQAQADKATIDAAMQRGIAASEAGDQAGAYAIFNEVATLAPNLREVWVWIGWTSPSLDDAEAAFQLAQEIDPTNEEAQMGLRWVESQRQGAEQEVSVGSNPLTSSMLTSTNLTSSPLTSSPLTSSILVSPGGVSAKGGSRLDEILERGMATAEAGNKVAAYNIFGQAVTDHPHSAEAWVWFGGTSSNLDEAESAFSRAWELEPGNEEAGLGLRWVTLRRAQLPMQPYSGAPAEGYSTALVPILEPPTENKSIIQRIKLFFSRFFGPKSN